MRENQLVWLLVQAESFRMVFTLWCDDLGVKLVYIYLWQQLKTRTKTTGLETLAVTFSSYYTFCCVGTLLAITLQYTQVNVT